MSAHERKGGDNRVWEVFIREIIQVYKSVLKMYSGVQIRMGKIHLHSIIYFSHFSFGSSATSGKYIDILLPYKVDIANIPANSFQFKSNGPADISILFQIFMPARRPFFTSS